MKKLILLKSVFVIILISLLGACNETKDDSALTGTIDAKIVSIGGNNVDGNKELRVITPTGRLIKKVEFFVNAEPIGSAEEGSFSVDWDPYYFSDELGVVTLDALITNVENNVVFEPEMNLNILPSSNQSLQISLENGLKIRNANQVTLSWKQLSDAMNYHVQLWSVNDPSLLIIDQKTNLTQLNVKELNAGEYIWHVKAVNQYDNWGAWTASTSFYITGPNSPIADSAMNESVISDMFKPVLSWEAVEFATLYNLELASDSSFSSLVTQIELSDTNFQSSELALGEYFWRLRSKNEFGFWGEWSEPYVFSISGPKPSNVISPVDYKVAATSQGVKLVWRTEGGVKYDIEVDDVKNFSSPAHYNDVAGDSLIVTNYGKGSNFWRIRSTNELNVTGDWSNIYAFVAKVSPAPEGSTIVPALIDVDTVWTKEGSPYYVASESQVLSGVTLTISSGVVVKFGDGASLKIRGQLKARGSADDMINFTSAYEQPNPGDWIGLSFSKSLDAIFDDNGNYVDGSILEFSKVKFGGSSPGNFSVNAVQSHPFINFNEISMSASVGIMATGGITISNNIIERNSSDGIRINAKASVSSSGDINIIGNLISKNTRSVYTWNHSKTNIIDNVFSQNNGVSSYIQSTDVENANSALYLGHGNAENIVSNNQFKDNVGSYNVSIYGFAVGTLIKNNTFDEGSDVFSAFGRRLIEIPHQEFKGNNIVSHNARYIIDNSSSDKNDLRAVDNWWGTNDAFEIEDYIYHRSDNEKAGLVTYNPFLSSPNIDAPISSPRNIQILSSDERTFEITWSENLESDIAGYRIYRDDDGLWPYDEIIDVGSALTHAFTQEELTSTSLVGVTAYDTSFVENNDNPLTRLNENQTAGNESLMTVLELN